ncbi:hypothetical protein JW926_01830 [Candidatus Sumerlaeota bacterium]|nr:hypothetical protein [Candidatus Sumerlaeota bacterium]
MNRKSILGGISVETLAGTIILIALGVIGATVWMVQGRYDKGFFKSAVSQNNSEAAAPVIEDSPPKILSGMEPEGFSPMSDAEIFNPDILSEKINGKADLYIECDFRELTARRYVNQKDPALWFEIYIYDMKEPRNAFSVYSMQRRPQTKDSAVAPFAYSTENALFFTHGVYYVEIVGAQASEILDAALVKTAEKIIAAYPSEPLVLNELSFLPPENMLKHTMKYFLKNAFGFEKMDNILTINYDVSEKEFMVFISERQGVSEAKALRDDYEKFLTAIGGKMTPDENPAIPDLAIIDLMGETEYFFSLGRFIAGIHAAPNREDGDGMVRILYDFMNVEMQK